MPASQWVPELKGSDGLGAAPLCTPAGPLGRLSPSSLRTRLERCVTHSTAAWSSLTPSSLSPWHAFPTTYAHTHPSNHRPPPHPTPNPTPALRRLPAPLCVLHAHAREALLSFVLHLDKHLAALIAQRGPDSVYALLFAIVFCETGLVLTPFLPGDSLLFAAGAFAGAVRCAALLVLCGVRREGGGSGQAR